MCHKHNNGRNVSEVWKLYINLNKIQRSNERLAQDKESIERQNDSWWWSANSLHSPRESRAVFNVNPAAKGHAGWQKSLQAGKNNF